MSEYKRNKRPYQVKTIVSPPTKETGLSSPHASDCMIEKTAML